MEWAILLAQTGASIIQGSLTASANRKMAEASMTALKLERDWNIGVMEKNRLDVRRRNTLESWGAGIDPTSGSTASVIRQNQRTLQEEIDFRKQQYDIEIANLKAQSKQKFLGLF